MEVSSPLTPAYAGSNQKPLVGSYCICTNFVFQGGT